MTLVDKRMDLTSTIKAFLLGWAFVVFATGCVDSKDSSGDLQTFVHHGDTQGTTYVVKYHGADSVPQAVLDEVLESIDVEFNLWRPDSRINALNSFDRTDSVFAFYDTNRLWSVMWDRSLEIREASMGAFDPTVHPLVDLWGFGLKHRTNVTPEAVDSILVHIGMTTDRIDMTELETNRIYDVTHIRKGDVHTSLDFNAIAQGFTVDLMGDALEVNGVEDYMVEIGGEVKCKGNRPDGQPWRIAIDRPVDETWGERPMEAVVSIKNAAICTSGNYRKFYESDGIRRSHTISPFTGYPVQHTLLSATIRAVDAATADALATACMVWGPDSGREFISFYRQDHPEEMIEAFFISATDENAFDLWQTDGWGADLVPVDQPLNP